MSTEESDSDADRNGLTDKQKSILEVAEENPDASKAQVARILKEQMGDDAPSQGYVYTVLSDGSNGSKEKSQQKDAVATLTISIPGQEDIDVDIQEAH